MVSTRLWPAAGVSGERPGDRQPERQSAHLADRRLLPIQRAALASRIGRRQGNRHLQKTLANLGQPARSPVAIQRQDDGQDEPTPEQKAAALAAATAAESQAGQSAQQAKSETSQSKAAGKVEKQTGQSAKQKASQAKAAAKAAKARTRGGKQKSRPGARPGKARPTAAAARPAGGAGKAGLEQAPASPEEDPAFQQVVAKVKGAGRRSKKHAPAGKKAAEAQAAAQVPARETSARAQAHQAGAMEAAPAPGFDGAAFKAALMARIAAMAPKTTAEADNFKSSNKLSSVKSQMTAKAGQAAKNAKEPTDSAAKQAPDSSAVPVRPASPLPPANPGPAARIPGAAKAAPKPKTTAEVEKPLQENARSLDQQMQDADISEEQLANSNEPEFQQALEAKKDAKTQAQTGPQAYRQAEKETLGQAQAEASGLARKRPRACTPTGQPCWPRSAASKAPPSPRTSRNASGSAPRSTPFTRGPRPRLSRSCRPGWQGERHLRPGRGRGQAGFRRLRRRPGGSLQAAPLRRLVRLGPLGQGQAAGDAVRGQQHLPARPPALHRQDGRGHR